MNDRPDILDELRAFKAGEIAFPSNDGILSRAIAEIERLRSLAGAVSDGPSMADIKARNDRLAEALKHVLSAPLPAWTSGDKP